MRRRCRATRFFPPKHRTRKGKGTPAVPALGFLPALFFPSTRAVLFIYGTASSRVAWATKVRVAGAQRGRVTILWLYGRYSCPTCCRCCTTSRVGGARRGRGSMHPTRSRTAARLSPGRRDRATRRRRGRENRIAPVGMDSPPSHSCRL